MLGAIITTIEESPKYFGFAQGFNDLMNCLTEVLLKSCWKYLKRSTEMHGYHDCALIILAVAKLDAIYRKHCNRLHWTLFLLLKFPTLVGQEN